jgi:superoxide dismutase, Fe-Mn family
VKGKSMNDQQGGVGPDALDGAVVLDVRRAPVFAQADAMIPGASWRDPAEVAQWAHELAPGQRVVVYCVHGHEVSQNTARSLRAAGIEADFLQDGFEGWKAAGRALAAKPAVP